MSATRPTGRSSPRPSARVKRLVGRAPKAVTADRGYGAAVVDAELATLGVKRVAIIRKGRQGAARQTVERRPGFIKLIKWRTGSEGRISSLKRGYGWNRSLMDGIGGTQTWCGYGVFEHNAIKISGLVAAKNDTSSDTELPPADPATNKRSRPRTEPPPKLALSA